MVRLFANRCEVRLMLSLKVLRYSQSRFKQEKLGIWGSGTDARVIWQLWVSNLYFLSCSVLLRKPFPPFMVEKSHQADQYVIRMLCHNLDGYSRATLLAVARFTVATIIILRLLIGS